MTRYVIEMDEPRSCRDCPMIWEDRTEGLEPSECQLADEWLPPGYDDNKPPEWCPLQRLDDSSQITKQKTVLRIRKVLGERCMTQNEAAELCGLKPQAFSRIVRGIEPAYPKRGKRIAEALGWKGDPAELFEEITV